MVQALYTEIVRPHHDFAKPDNYNYNPLHALSIREKNKEEKPEELTPNTSKRATSRKVQLKHGIAANILFDVWTF